MEQTNCLKDFIRYTSLNVLGMIGLSFYILADTFFVSNGVGANGLTALNLAVPVYSFIHGSGLMFGIGGASKYSVLRGQKAYQDSNRVFTNSGWPIRGFLSKNTTVTAKKAVMCAWNFIRISGAVRM